MSDMELEEIPLPPTGIIKSTKKPIKLVRKRPLSVALNQDGISDRDQKCDQKALSLEQKPSKLSTKKVVVTSWDDHIATSWDNPPSQTSIDFKDQIRQAGLEPLKISVSGDRRTVLDKNPPDQDKVLNKTNKEKEEKEKREKEKMAKVDMVFHEFLSQKMAVIEEEHKLKLKNLKEQAKKEDDEEFVFKESESGKDHKEKHKKHKKDKKKDKEKNKEKKKDRKDKDKKQKSKYKNHEHSKSRESNRDFINESDQSPCQDRSSREHSISMHKYEKDKSKKEKKKDKKDKKDKHFSDSKDKRDKSKDKGEHKRDMQSKDTHVSNTIESGDQKTNKDKSHHKNLDSEEKSDIKKQDKGEMYGDRKSASPRGDKMHRDSSNERKYSSKSDIRHQRSNSKEEFKKSRSGEERPFIESSKVKKVEEPEEITMADLIFLKKQLEAQIDKKDSKKEVKESPKEAENLEITKTVEQGAQIKSTLILNLPDKTDQHETAQDLGKDDKKIEDTEKAVKQAVDLAVVATGDVLADVIAASLVEKDAKPKGKDEDKNGSSTKRPILKLGIKISETSTALIQSGVRVEKTDVIVEEGEILDSESDTSSSSCDDADSYLDFDNSGEDADSKGKKKRKKTKKHKHKKKKKTKLEKEETKKYTKSRSRSRSPKKHKHSRSRSRSQTPTLLFDKKTGIWKENSRSKSRERRRERSRSRSPWLREKRRSRSRERRRSRSPHDRHGRDRHRSSRSREREHRDRERQQRAQQRWQGKFKEWRRSRSKEKTPVDLRLKIDKAKLREIAIANAYANAQTGSGPPINLKPEQIAAMKSGGQTVQELTEFCKKMAKKDGALSSGSDGEIKPGGSDDEEGTFIHHPFKVREAPTSIVMNIRNAKQLPVLTPAEKMAQQSTLRLQFPVSSGTQHRDKEGEWVPVEKVPPASTMVVATVSSPSVVATGKVSVAPPGAATLSVTAPPPPPPPIDDKVFPDLPPEALQPINIGAVVSERLSAMRKLQENPNDVEAMSKMYKLQKEMNHWAQSKQLPGQFTGTTGVQVLTPQELAGPDPKNQAWLKKDTFTKAKPVGQGIGMYLLQKMGWKQGTGLGKNNEGSLEPLHLDFKIDRRGLSSQDESAKKRPGPMPVVRDLSGKHPVSALMELCTKRKWGSPDFIIVNEAGPDHKKNFIFKVKVNGQEFQPATASTNKKQAKASAATVCLQELGLLPRGGSNHAGPI